MNRVTNYLKATKAEMRHVAWPTQKTVIYFTIIVIVISLLTAVFLGFFDMMFTWMLENFVL